MLIKKCEGEGHGSCKRCTDSGKWNRMWMCFLYRIEGLDGCYCGDCVKEIAKARKCGTCVHSDVCSILEEVRDPLGWVDTQNEFVCSYYRKEE